jgi:hypothetical protein
MKKTVISACMCALLAACASSGDQAASSSMEEKYVPTGSNIPRKSANRDSKVIMSPEAAEQASRSGGTPAAR